MAKKKHLGIVVSNNSKKTIIVITKIRYQHPKYVKTLVKTKRLMAHDETNLCSIGDLVLIEESAPISRRKVWVLKEILNKSKQN
jgi:small subunit ribosomal protein S17